MGGASSEISEATTDVVDRCRTQVAAFQYDDCMLEFEVRGLPTNDERGVKVGNLFYGTKGCMTINGDKWATYMGHKKVTGTYWYLTGIPELMAIAARRFQQFSSPRKEGAK